MKKSIRCLVTLIFCLSMIMATFIPAYAASVAQVKGLAATNVTYNSAVLTWTKASKVNGYELENYNSSSKKWTVVNSDIKSSATSYSLTNLTTGTTYKYRIRAFTKSLFGKKTYGAYSATLSVKPMPAQVTGAKASTITATTAKLTWTKVAGATGYKVQIYKNSKWTNHSTVKTNSLSVTKLSVNTTYKFRIAAYRTVSKKDFIGAYSATVSFKTAVGKVTGLTVSDITATTAKATWKAVSDVTGYKIVLTDPNGKKIVNTTTTKTTYSFSKLPPKVKYTLKVTAYKTISKKDYNGTAVSTTFTPKLAAPTNLKTTVKPTSIAVSWTKAANATGYNVRLYDSKGAQIKSVTTTNASYTLSSIAPGTYTVKVYSYVTVSGTKYYSAALASAKLKLTLPAPTDLVTTVKPTSIAVSWTKAASATGYSVRLYDKDGKQLKSTTTTKTSYTFSSIAPGTYTADVRSYVTISGTKYYSAALASSKLKATVPAPTGLVTTVNPTSIAVSWTKAANAEGYRVILLDKDDKQLKSVYTENANYTLKDVTPNASYTVKVNSYVTVDKKYYSSAILSETLKTTVPIATSLKTTVTPTSIAVSWTKAANAEGYSVRLFDKNGTQLKSVTTKNATYTFSGIAPGTYTADVRSYVTADKKYYSSKLASSNIELTLPAPTDLNTTVTPTSIAVSWTKAAYAEGYSVRLFDKDGKQLKSETTTNASYTFSSLEPNTKYTVDVCSYITVDKKYYSSAISSAVLETTFAAPTNLKVTETTSNSVALSWAAAADANGYEVEYYTGSTWKTSADETALKATVSSLASDTTYKFRVRAYIEISSKKYYSLYSSEVSSTTLITPVSNLEAYKATKEYIYVSWDAVKGATGYRVSCPGTATQDITDTSTRITYLEPNTEYTISVQAYKTTSGKTYYTDAKTVNAKTLFDFKHSGLSYIKKLDYFYMDEAYIDDPEASFVLRWEEINNAVYTVKATGEIPAPTDTNCFEVKESSAETFSAWAETPGGTNYKTKISWEPQSGVSTNGYTIQVADTMTKKWFNVATAAPDKTSVEVYLAPNTTYNARVIASTTSSKLYTIFATDKDDPELNEYEYIYSQQRPQLYAVTDAFTTPAAPAFDSNSNEIKTLYTLWAVQALNNTKVEKGKLTVANNMDMDISIDDSTITIKGKLLSKKYKLFEFLDSIETIAAIFGIDVGDIADMDIDGMKADLKSALNSNEAQTVTFNGGFGDMKTTNIQYIYNAADKVRFNADNTEMTSEVTKMVKTTPFDFISPNSEYAYFHNSQDVANFSKKIQNIEVQKSEDNSTTTIKLTLKEENASGTPVHDGFISGLSDMGSGASSLRIGKGNKTVITFVINKDGTLNSYNIHCPFRIEMKEASDMMDLNIVMDGPLNYDYKFTR